MAEARPARILVVDDDEASRYATARIMRSAGFESLEAGDATTGLELAPGADLIIFDVNLPDFSGFETCRRIRANPRTAGIPVIHLTASKVTDPDKVLGLEMGADGYLVDPVDPLVLIATVKAFLRARRAESERERLLASERAARQEAERANRLKDDFLATLSHELRTPLHSILGWAHVMRMPEATARDFSTGLDAIERNAQAQSEMIADLLDTSRIISGKLRLETRLLNPAATVEAALESVTGPAEAKRIALRCELDANARSVMADPARLQQVVWNLFSNAIKFTPEGGDISVRLRAVGEAVEIIVRDSGEGIAPDLLPHIFERFFQGDASTRRKTGGLGLGLSIVQQLVEMHGGTVEATSAGVGRGSSFIVRLPLARETQLAAGNAASPPAMPAAGQSAPLLLVSLRGVRILVVDDDADARELLDRLLHEYGAAVATAANAAAGFQLARKWRPDVVVSDVGMPGRDGFDFIKEMRESEDCAHIPAIALTAFARAEDGARVLAGGFQGYITKPVDPQRLLQTIAELAAGSAADAAQSKAVWI